MAKSADAKAMDDSAGEKVLRRFQEEAARRMATEGENIDPVATQVRARAVVAQLEEARTDGTPELLGYDGNPRVLWVGLIDRAIEDVSTEANRPGAKSKPMPVPEELRIDPAIAAANEGRQRVMQVIDSDPGNPQNAALKLQITGDRRLVGGKARWETEMTSIVKAIESMGEAAPIALRTLLPRLRACVTQLEQARAQPAGKESTAVIYSEAARRSALTLDLMLRELRAWSAATATDKRNGRVLSAISPKRRSDAKAASREGSTGEGAAQKEKKASEENPSESKSRPQGQSNGC